MNRPETDGDRRLFIDVTRTLCNDQHTGIQRVVRALTRAALRARSHAAFPVTLEGNALQTLATLPAHRLETGEDHARITGCAGHVRPNDVLLLADASWYTDPWPAVDNFLAAGGIVVGFVHDLLPLRCPQWFRPDTTHRFREHLLALLDRAGLLLAPTEHVAAQLREDFGLARDGAVQVLPLCGQLDTHRPHEAAVEAKTYEDVTTRGTAPRVPDGDFVLSVGTLEPRKGQAALLDAFDCLWRRGKELQLVFVGAPGWLVSDLEQRLHAHPLRGQQLHWLHDATDDELIALYRQAAALVALSEDEGFGLPLAEAARFGCPVLARDIPVFREIMREDAIWIDRSDREGLAEQLLQCVNRVKKPAVGAAHPGRERRREPTQSRFATRTWDHVHDELQHLISGVIVRAPIMRGRTDGPATAGFRDARP